MPRHWNFVSTSPLVRSSHVRFLLPAAIFVLCLSSQEGRAQDRTAVRKVAPVYPVTAKLMHISGNVIVVATIDATGNVVKTESDSPYKLLVGAALDAVKQWKFAPGDGTATIKVQVNFEAPSS